jgi:hypothetical protein
MDELENKRSDQKWAVNGPDRALGPGQSLPAAPPVRSVLQSQSALKTP